VASREWQSPFRLLNKSVNSKFGAVVALGILVRVEHILRCYRYLDQQRAILLRHLLPQATLIV
jgi:hypothetical protein